MKKLFFAAALVSSFQCTQVISAESEPATVAKTILSKIDVLSNEVRTLIERTTQGSESAKKPTVKFFDVEALQTWITSHKKGLLIAGASLTAVVAAYLLVKHFQKDSFPEQEPEFLV